MTARERIGSAAGATAERPSEEVIVQAPSARRLPKLPLLLRPGVRDEGESFTDLDTLVSVGLAVPARTPLSLTAGAAALPGFDTFPAVTVYAGGVWLATVYLPGVTADTAREALSRALGLIDTAEAA